MTKIIIMLLWLGDFRGGPTVITGFNTLAGCETARPLVVEGFLKLKSRLKSGTVIDQEYLTSCMELGR